MSKIKTRNILFLRPLVFFVFLLVIFEILVKIGTIQKFIIPAPSDVFKIFFLSFDDMLPHLIETVWVCSAGLLLSIVFSIGIVILMDLSSYAKDTIYPVLVISQTIPVMVISPVIIMVLGFGLAPRILVVLLVCFFPVAANLYDGFKNTDSDLLNLMKTLNSSKWKTLINLKLPGSLPQLFSGIKIASAYGVMATIIAEWQGSNAGLGVYLLRVRRSYNYDKVFAATLLIILTSLAFFLLAHLAEKLYIRFRYKISLN